MISIGLGEDKKTGDMISKKTREGYDLNWIGLI
jgi:hypothetical protein